MSTTFTRGPWTVLPPESDKDYVRVRGTHLGSRYKIANVHDPLTNERPETNANARLIASAPDLLAELQEVLEWARVEKAPLRAQEMQSIARLIAKATGGTQ